MVGLNEPLSPASGPVHIENAEGISIFLFMLCIQNEERENNQGLSNTGMENYSVF